MGQDANWDLVNYHLYNPLALMRGRTTDVAVAGMQSFFNPLLDLPYATLAMGALRKSPHQLAALMGLWSGLLFWLAIRLSGVLLVGWARVAGAALAMTGAATIGETGTTFGDIPVAVLTLGSVLVVLRGLERWRLMPGRLVWAGVLMGLACGLKPTAVPYAAALAAAMALRVWPRRMAWFALGGAIGWAVTGGWWALRLWRHYGNPVFPLFNSIFHSPWYPPDDFVDKTRIPATALRWLAAPLWWAWRVSDAATEAPSRDPRMAIALVLAFMAVAYWAARRRPTRLTPAQQTALAFTAFGYAAWLATSATGRYAVVTEVMAGLCIPLLLQCLGQRAVLGVPLAACAALLTHYPDWGRRPYGRVTAQSNLTADTLAVALDAPVSYAVPLLPPGIAVGLLHTTLEARGWRLHDDIVARVAVHEGPVSVLARDPAPFRPVLAEIGLDPAIGPCQPVISVYDPAPGGVWSCTAHKALPPALLDPFWTASAGRYAAIHWDGPVWPFTGYGYLIAAGPAARGVRFLEPGTYLWTGFHTLLPARPRPDTLYILGNRAPQMQLGPDDAVLQLDGITVIAPGWRRAGLTAPNG